MRQKKNGSGGIKKARKPTENELALARKNGFRSAKPKKGNVKATVASVNAYIAKYNAWADKVRDRAKAQKAKEADHAKGKQGKQAISGL